MKLNDFLNSYVGNDKIKVYKNNIDRADNKTVCDYYAQEFYFKPELESLLDSYILYFKIDRLSDSIQIVLHEE